jgi:hypothetical protein
MASEQLPPTTVRSCGGIGIARTATTVIPKATINHRAVNSGIRALGGQATLSFRHLPGITKTTNSRPVLDTDPVAAAVHPGAARTTR